MIFSSEGAIPKILSGEKTQTRRLAKLVDWFQDGVVYNINGVAKWQVGKSYAVQSGRGKPTIKICDLPLPFPALYPTYCEQKVAEHFLGKPKDLRIQVSDIEEQKLCDITTEEAHKEGYRAEGLCARPVFLSVFMKINWHEAPKEIRRLVSEGDENSFVFAAEQWNPRVFALTFGVL